MTKQNWERQILSGATSLILIEILCASPLGWGSFLVGAF